MQQDVEASRRGRIAFAQRLACLPGQTTCLLDFAGRRERFSAAEEAHTLAGYRRECAVEVEAARQLIAARAAMQQRRTEYLEAHRKLEVVNRLETRARTEHRLAANREEQAEFDDYAGRQVARRNLSTV